MKDKIVQIAAASEHISVIGLSQSGVLYQWGSWPTGGEAWWSGWKKLGESPDVEKDVKKNDKKETIRK